MDPLSAGDGGSRSWHFLMWHQWVAALPAEAAVLAHDPGAARHLAEAKAGADRGALTRCRSWPGCGCGSATRTGTAARSPGVYTVRGAN